MIVALGLRRDGQPVDTDYVRVRGKRAALLEEAYVCGGGLARLSPCSSAKSPP